MTPISDLLIDSTDYLYFFNDQYDWAEDNAVELMQDKLDLHEGNCGWLDMIENFWSCNSFPGNSLAR